MNLLTRIQLCFHDFFMRRHLAKMSHITNEEMRNSIRKAFTFFNEKDCAIQTQAARFVLKGHKMPVTSVRMVYLARKSPIHLSYNVRRELHRCAPKLYRGFSCDINLSIIQLQMDYTDIYTKELKNWFCARYPEEYIEQAL